MSTTLSDFFNDDLPLEQKSPTTFLEGGGRIEGDRFVFEVILENKIKWHYRKFDNVNYISFVISVAKQANRFDYSHFVFVNRDKWPEHQPKSDYFLTVCEMINKYNLAFTISEEQLKSLAVVKVSGKTCVKFEISNNGLFKFMPEQLPELVNWKLGLKSQKTIDKKPNSIF